MKIIKTDGIRIVPGSQLLFGGWIQILLKQRKNILCDRFVFKSEYGRKTAPPVPFDSVVLAVIVIIGKVLTIEIRAFAMCGFDLCRGEQNTFPHTPYTKYHTIRRNANRKNKVFRKKRGKEPQKQVFADAISYRDR